MKKLFVSLSFAFLIGSLSFAGSLGQVLDKACLIPPSDYLISRPAIAAGDVLDEKLILTKWGAFKPKEKGFLSPDGFSEIRSCPDQYILKFDHALDRSEMKIMERQGIRIIGMIPYNGYVVEGKAALMGNLNGTYSVSAFSPLLKIEPLLYKTEWPVPPIISISLTEKANPMEFLREKKECYPELEFLSVFEEKPPVLRIFYTGADHRRFLADLALDERVIYIEPWFLPQPRNDNSIYVVQSYDTLNKTNYSICATIWNQGITGTDETPAVCDTGLDSDMCFYRLSSDSSAITDAQYPDLPDPGTLEPSKKVIVYDVLPGASAYDGQYTCSSGYHHGTHVCGSVAGDNYATLSTSSSGGHDTGDGMAPNAKLIFQDAGLEVTGCLNGLANDYQLIFQQANDAGARIHSDSWGGSAGGIYDGDCRSVDTFSYDHEDFLFFFAAGNGGPSSMTIDSPGAAKNVIAVGAATNGSSGANSLASFSGRGPCADGRLKPDLVAPGVSINSASADELHSSNNCSTRLGSGTSMATPTAAGAATLLREYFRKGYYPTGSQTAADSIMPSSALMKAMLINGAVEITATSQSNMMSSLYPGTSEGWGRLLLDTALFFSQPSRDSRGLRLWDKWNRFGLSTGEEDSYPVYIGSSGEPLKVTLVWTEPPPSPYSGIALSHDLDLEVTSPSGDKYTGNSFESGSSHPGAGKDGINNVEEVFILTPENGTWQIKVKGYYIPYMPGYDSSDKQGYALVASFADCGGSSLSVSSLVASDDAPSGISLSWGAVTGASGYQVFRADGSCSAAADSYKYIGDASGNDFSDASVQGGKSYAYKVRALNSCAEGPLSACAYASFTGNCSLKPSFSGLESAASNSSAGCAIYLAWSPAVSNCPSSPAVVYNIYRSTDPYDEPSPRTLIKSGVSSAAYTDFLVIPNLTYYYTVRAEDGTSSNGGPNNGGNEDTNVIIKFAAAHSGTFSYGTYSDEGGDGSARLTLGPPWKITLEENHTSGGKYSYHTGDDFFTYPNGLCAAAQTGDIPLEVSSSPVLSYYVDYNIEDGYDGCVVEISTDGGSSWSTIAPSGGYPGNFGSTGSPPGNACGYDSTQGAFSGPKGNASLTGWVNYNHDLSAYAGQTAEIRWVLSSDGGASYQGMFLDDISITHAGIYDDCLNSDGALITDNSKYSCSDTITIRLYDSDLLGSGSAAVTVKSDTETSGESLVLTETPASSGHFSGSINTISAAPASDGLLSLGDGDTITASYLDANDGHGGLNIIKSVKALGVCSPPDEVAPGILPWDIQSFWQDKATQVWPEIPGAEKYRLYRGTVSQLPNLLNGGIDSCLQYEGILPEYLCSENPALVTGRLYWYLVTAINRSGEGSAGSATAGQRIVNSTTCP
jgi:hypothetical protein